MNKPDSVKSICFSLYSHEIVKFSTRKKIYIKPPEKQKQNSVMNNKNKQTVLWWKKRKKNIKLGAQKCSKKSQYIGWNQSFSLVLDCRGWMNGLTCPPFYFSFILSSQLNAGHFHCLGIAVFLTYYSIKSRTG